MASMTADCYQWIGSGLYTIAEAARLTGITPGRVRRWMRGYTFVRKSEPRTSPPVILGQYALSEHGSIALSFMDLVEVRFVDAFLKKGVRWPTLREAHDKAARELGVSHPFATRKFATDGHSILARIGQAAIVDIVGGQLGFHRILKDYLVTGLDFKDQVAVRWWPLGRHRPVVVDAARSFGQPIVSREGVPTAVLHRAYIAESRSQIDLKSHAVQSESAESASGNSLHADAIERVAKWYDVERRSVRAAVEYELQLAA
jgi:helix-turn-helix protein